MVKILDDPRVRRVLPFLAAAGVAIVAVTTAMLPGDMLAAVGEAAGVVLAGPMEIVVRVGLAVLVGGIVALLFWGALRRPRRAEAVVADAAPVLRRADAHPDAPSRRPIFASEDLGKPMDMPLLKAKVPKVPANAQLEERSLPDDLSVPMATFDPAAMPDAPREPVRAVPALAMVPNHEPMPGRIETFELTPMVRNVSAAEPAPSLASLLDRLEGSAARRAPVPRRSIDETLGMLRQLATG